MTKARGSIFLMLAVMLVVSARPMSAQDGQSIFDEIRNEHQWIEKHLHEPSPGLPAASRAEPLVRSQAITAAAQTIDVQHYRLQIRLNLNAGTMSGSVQINRRAGQLCMPAQKKARMHAGRKFEDFSVGARGSP